MKPLFSMVIFDMDGTIFESNINWKAVKKELDISSGKTILEDIMSDANYSKKKIEILENIERKNTLNAYPFEGFKIFFKKLEEEGLKKALITNNNKSNTDYLLNKFTLDFDLVVTREMKMWKPYPHAMRYVINKFNLSADRVISIGDSDYDIKASKQAGIDKIYIKENNLKKRINTENGVSFFSNYSELYSSIFN